MRSIFLKHESWNDVQNAIGKAENDQELRHLLSERLKENGWTKDKEIAFRHCCSIVGFVLPHQRAEKKTVGKDTQGRTTSRLLTDAARHELRQSKIVGDVE